MSGLSRRCHGALMRSLMRAQGWDLLRGYGVEPSDAGPDGSGPFVQGDFDRPESAGADELVGTNFERKFRRAGKGFHAGVLRKVGG